ncbi:MAG: hypothetical protein LBN10_08350 [Propionibacteriaceae bacterium]|jgi:hypothetical protein|nr:hypothetical protein [Propionibacteriaceae bacterium]
MISKQEIVDIATDKAHLAAEKGSAAWEEAVERITPLIEQAAAKAGPYADQAKKNAVTYGKRAAGFAADQVERIQPGLNSALDKVSPAIDKAQRAVQDDLVPRLLEVLRNVADTPTGQEARELLQRLDERTDASVVALKGELAKTKKQSSKTKTVITIAAVGAVVGALVVAVKTFLGSKDDWASYEPDEPYVYPDDDPEIDSVIVEAEVVESSPAEEVEESEPYGEGSYQGPNPPEGYVIKGNQRSMKFHVPGAAGYARTNGDVWFATEDAAVAAGFVRSQR